MSKSKIILLSVVLLLSNNLVISADRVVDYIKNHKGATAIALTASVFCLYRKLTAGTIQPSSSIDITKVSQDLEAVSAVAGVEDKVKQEKEGSKTEVTTPIASSISSIPENFKPEPSSVSSKTTVDYRAACNNIAQEAAAVAIKKGLGGCERVSTSSSSSSSNIQNPWDAFLKTLNVVHKKVAAQHVDRLMTTGMSEAEARNSTIEYMLKMSGNSLI